MDSKLQAILNFGHHIDSRWRRYRCVVLLERFREYRSWLRLQRNSVPVDKPLVVFDFADNRIDGPQGRRFYTLFMFFIRSGFYPLIKENYLFLANIQERHKRFCLLEAFSVVKHIEEIDSPYILITDRVPRLSVRRKASQVITVDYRSDYCPSHNCFPMPFPMFSEIYAAGQDLHLSRYRSQTRRWNVFFGGDAESKKYSKPVISSIYKKLPRAQVLTILRDSLPAELWREPTQDDFPTLSETCFDGLMVVNTRKCKVPSESWLQTVANAHFFLACPGVRYPMSHNIVESMAVGTIPITQYPELFFPPLEHGKNCLVYSSEDDLTSVVIRAITMDESARQQMSVAAAAYYDENLAPETTIKRILARQEKVVNLRLLPFLKRGGGYA